MRNKNKDILLTIIFILSLVLFVQCGKSEKDENSKDQTEKTQKDKPVSQEEREEQKIKELGVKVKYKYAKKNNEEKEELVGKTFYDSLGRKVEQIKFSSGSLYLKWTFDYDENGNMIRSDVVDGQGNPDSYVEYEFDSEGREIKKVEENFKSRRKATFETSYDDNGRKIQTKTYNKNDELKIIQNYEYENGMLVQGKSYDTKGNLIAVSKVDYDDQNRKIKETRDLKGSGQTSQEFMKWEYNDQDEPTLIETNIYRRMMKYDENGNLTSDMMFATEDSTRQYKFEFYYDDSTGLQNKVIRYNPDDEPLFEITYKYDFYDKQ